MQKKKEMIIVFLVASIMIAGILFGTGTIFSGWHLVDDHETVRMAVLDANEGVGFSKVLWRNISQDMHKRWRPLYQVFRVADAYLFGLNSVIPNCLLCVAGILTYILLYYSARNIGSSILFGHLFASVVLLGGQFEIWYRIANQENLGMLFLAMCLWLITSQFKEQKYNAWQYDILLTSFALACATMKESFLIVLPGMIVLRIFLEMLCNKEKAGIVIKRHWLMCVLTFGVFAFSMTVILKYVGTNTIGYAGIDPDSGIKGIIWNLLRMCNNSLKIYLIIAVICCFFLILSWKNILELNKDRRILTGVFLIFGLYIVAGEMVLHAKSDMWNRYLVPFTLGYGLILIILAENVLKKKYLKMLYVLVMLVFLGTRLYLSIFTRAADYASEGREIQNVLNYIQENTESDAKIVTSLGEGERDMAFSIYLEFADRKNVYMYEENADIWQDVYQVYGSTEKLKAGEECDLYILEGRADNQDMEEKYFSDSGWENIKFGKWYDVWVNKSAKEK